MLTPTIGKNAEGYCKKCGAPLGISGQCTICALGDHALPASPATCEEELSEMEEAALTQHDLWITEKDRHAETMQQLRDMTAECDFLTGLNDNAVEILNEIISMADASADGHDEINEHTPEAYIKLLESRLTAICKSAIGLSVMIAND